MTGRVYLVGAGPGDPTLITIRGAEVLGLCDLVLYDALAHPALLEYMRPGAEARFVGKRGFGESEPQSEINRQLVEEANAGKVVVRLKGGDPLLFARGAEECEVLADAKIPFEIVPGIASPVAVAAYAGIPLTHRDWASSVLFLTGTPRDGRGPDGHDWKRLATRAGTICILMGMARIREIAASLIENGRDAATPTAVVEWGARPSQRTVVAPLSDIADRVAEAKLGSPAVIVIGEVVSLRAKLSWYERLPLFGKRIGMTRASGQDRELARELRVRGAEALSFPTIEITAPPNPSALGHAIGNLHTYDVIALTSPNGAAALFRELKNQHLDARAFGEAKIAVIGPGTARAVETHALYPDIIAEEFRGEGLAKAVLTALPKPNSRVLVVRAKVAREALPEALRAAGHTVDVVAAYETVVPKDAPTTDALRAALTAKTLDALTLTSSSTVENLVTMLGPDAPALLEGVKLVSIGPITTDTAQRLGLSVAATANPYSLDGLVAALANICSQ